jgi:FdhD protein
VSDATRPGPTTPRPVREWRDGRLVSTPDRVVTEEPLEIRLAWPGVPAQRVAVTMRTPGHDFELAAGFLLAERVLTGAEPIHSVGYCRDRRLTGEQQYNVVTVELTEPPHRAPSARFGAVSSACGVCGIESLADVFPEQSTPIVDAAPLDPAVVAVLPDELRTHQPLFDKTGAVHAAGLFAPDGSLVVVREDVGRHNAVDKVMGSRLLGLTSFGESSVLCVSGRIGFDIVAKAVTGRVGAVVGVGAPSSLAVQLADRAGIMVCGFARRGRFVVYTHPDRLVAA